MTTGVQIMPTVIRKLTLIALAVATLAAAACGGEESAVCGDLENIQSSIQGVGDIELEEGALEELQQTAADIDADLQAAQANADAELGDELDALRTAVQALVSEAETAAATGLSGESVQALSAAISDVRTSFQATQAAAPDCDL
jgi:phage host-nuclease inhibitor protein Gam